MTKAPAIHLRGTHFIDGTRLFGPVDMVLPAQQWTCVLGRSGVGKSTLLRLIAGLPCAGTFDGQILRYDYSFGDFGVALSAEIDDGVMEFSSPVRDPAST